MKYDLIFITVIKYFICKDVLMQAKYFVFHPQYLRQRFDHYNIFRPLVAATTSTQSKTINSLFPRMIAKLEKGQRITQQNQ